jgi:F-type H+-transporting ATPase subunit gamma
VTRLTEIEAQTSSMVELRDIVGAMRSLASMRVQEAQHRLPGVRSYAEIMATAVGDALLLLPNTGSIPAVARGRAAFVLCTAEHGFVGGFNEHLLNKAEPDVKSGKALYLLGSRGAAAARERGWEPAWTSTMPTRPEGAPEAIRHLTTELYRGIAAGALARIVVMFARYRQSTGMTIERRLLLPLDTASLATALPQPPLHTLLPAILLERLIADYVFALLIEATIESLSSENAARFAAMQSAYDNISKKLEQLQQDARQARQTEITNELLDLIIGTEAQAATPNARENGIPRQGKT